MRKTRFLSTVLVALFFLIGLVLVPIRRSAASANVIDEAGIFSTQQLLDLDDLAYEISTRQQCGVYVVITDDMHGYSERSFAEGIFMNYDLGFGEGEGASGVILAISYGDRYYDCYAYGAAGDTFTTSTLDDLNDLAYQHLVNGDWYGAAESFIKRCDELLTSTGYQYYVPVYTDPPINQHITSTSPEERRNAFLSRLPFASLGSAAVGGIVVAIMRGKNKNIGVATNADRYIIKNGVRLIDSKDVFVNRTRTVTHIARSEGGGGGGGGGGHSYHSSGGVHSSGGGHF